MREIETPSLASDAMTIDDLVEHMPRELAALTPASRGINAPMFNDGIRENAAQLCAHRAGCRMTGPVDGQVLRTNEEAVIAGHEACVERQGGLA